MVIGGGVVMGTAGVDRRGYTRHVSWRYVVNTLLYQHLRRGYAMPVSVAAKWSSRGEPRFVKTGCLMH